MNLWLGSFLNFALIVLLLRSVTATAQMKSRIINGTATLENNDWVVSLSEKGIAPSKGHFCGGSIIEPNWVVTAAHCVFNYYNAPHLLQVHFGSNSLQQGPVVSVDGIILHPEFEVETSKNDIALVHLSQAVDVSPIHIYQGSEQDLQGMMAEVLGWGLTDPNGTSKDLPPSLQAASIPIQPQDFCRSTLQDAFDPTSMLCAGILSTAIEKYDGVDSCYGDSGGPLVVNVSGQKQIVGLVSWGLECASARAAGVYTNLVTLRDWLKEDRALPGYAMRSPKVHGQAVVGKQLNCKRPQLGGGPIIRTKYRWRDAESQRVLARSSKVKLKASFVKRRLTCEVEMVSASSSTFSYSKPTKQIRRALQLS